MRSGTDGYAGAEDAKSSKVAAVASDGRFWVSRVLSTISELEKDVKHVKPLNEADEEEAEQRQKAREILGRLKDVSASAVECCTVGTDIRLTLGA